MIGNKSVGIEIDFFNLLKNAYVYGCYANINILNSIIMLNQNSPTVLFFKSIFLKGKRRWCKSTGRILV